ncbi:MAG TPA: LytR C-terminal domain-containing protein [Actinomycetota bacterium]|nr:LytR C-terminal domain-containing protein [Actinomycetota bacterium]
MIGWSAPWIIIAIVVGFAVWRAIETVDRGKEQTVATTAPTPTPSPEPTPSPTFTPIPLDEDEGVLEGRDPGPSPSPSLLTEDVTVQVLNGSSNETAGEGMAGRLEELGYEVVVVQEAARPYAETTVFYSTEEDRPAAEALAAHFDWIVEPKPESLAAEVSIHVVVGEDETSPSATPTP